jgi:hypothetical protein
MQVYPVRANHRANLAPPALAELVRTHIGAPTVDGSAVSASFGALVRLLVQAQGRELRVEVTMDPKVGEEVARETVARYNRFLEAVTGYTAKERARRLRKTATAGAASD